MISVAEIVRDSVQNSATGQETVDFGFDWECFPGSVEGAVSSSVRVFVLRRSATGKIVGKKNCVDIEVSSPPLWPPIRLFYQTRKGGVKVHAQDKQWHQNRFGVDFFSVFLGNSSSFGLDAVFVRECDEGVMHVFSSE